MNYLQTDELVKRLQHVIEHGIAGTDGNHAISAEAILKYIESNQRNYIVPNENVGHWVEDYYCRQTQQYKCSSCNTYHLLKYYYCPTCGTKMEDGCEAF